MTFFTFSNDDIWIAHHSYGEILVNAILSSEKSAELSAILREQLDSAVFWAEQGASWMESIEISSASEIDIQIIENAVNDLLHSYSQSQETWSGVFIERLQNFKENL